MDYEKLNNRMEEGWLNVLKPFIQSYIMDHIIARINAIGKKDKVIPPPDKVFNTFKNCPFNELKIVILGQDPYPNKEDACGSAFSAGNPIHIPASLKNILMEVEREYGLGDLDFDGDLSRWEEQGVLLLNTSLTVTEGTPGSHKGIWDPFIKEVFKAINTYHTGIIFMLWGNHAKSYKPLISDKQYILEASHPSPLSCNRGNNPFNGCGHFKKANELIEQMNGKEYMIKW